MKNFLIVLQLLMLLFCAPLVLAQEDPFPRLYQSDLPDAEITRSEIYVGEELWGLINGGADLYLEYGLDRTLLQEVVRSGKNYRIEIYGMTNIDAAFGIYSINKFNCVTTDTLTQHTCITPYQLQAAVSRFYISISNQSGDRYAQKYSLFLFEKLLSKIELETFIVPEYFQQPQFEEYQNKVKLIKGKLGLQNGFPRWDKFFNGFSNYEIVLLPIKTEDGYLNTAKVVFSSDEDAERFSTNNTNFERIKTISQKELLLLESNLDRDQIDKMIN